MHRLLSGWIFLAEERFPRFFNELSYIETYIPIADKKYGEISGNKKADTLLEDTRLSIQETLNAQVSF